MCATTSSPSWLRSSVDNFGRNGPPVPQATQKSRVARLMPAGGGVSFPLRRYNRSDRNTDVAKLHLAALKKHPTAPATWYVYFDQEKFSAGKVWPGGIAGRLALRSTALVANMDGPLSRAARMSLALMVCAILTCMRQVKQFIYFQF